MRTGRFTNRRNNLGLRLPHPLSRNLASVWNQDGSDWYQQLFLDEFATFLATPLWKDELQARINGAKLGSGIAQYVAVQFLPRRATKIALQWACRILMAQPLTENGLGAVLHTTGTQHVIGFGMNLISKILT